MTTTAMLMQLSTQVNGTNPMASVAQRIKEHSVSLYAGMTPNFRFNTCMIVIWGILLTFQIAQLIYKQYWFSVAFICTGVLEVLGYIGRTWSHHDTTLMNPFLLNMICLTIAPVFTMGGMYYQMAKLIEIYGHKYSIIKSPMLYSYIFISSDIVSLAIQAAGGGTAGMAVNQGESTDNGDNIFVAGLAIQVASMLIFLILWFYFLHSVFIGTRLSFLGQSPRKLYSRKIWSVSNKDIDHMFTPKYHKLRLQPERWEFRYFTLGMTIAVLTIFTRCCYRLAELAEGWSGYLITHEWYFIILDALMMTLATIAMTTFHPGYAFLGRTQSIPIGNKKNKKKHSKKKNINKKWLFFKKNSNNNNNDDLENNLNSTSSSEDDYDFEDDEDDSNNIHDEEKRNGVPDIETSSKSHTSKSKFNWKFW